MFWNVTAPGTIFVVLSCTVLAEAVSKSKLIYYSTARIQKVNAYLFDGESFLPKVDSFISFNLIRSFKALSSSMLDLGPAPVGVRYESVSSTDKLFLYSINRTSFRKPGLNPWKSRSP